MTQNAIAYLSMKETERSNLAREKETNRANLARETETLRSNVANEAIKREANRITDSHYMRMDAETSRSNKARENLTARQLSEVERSNRVVQAETQRMNNATIMLRQQEVTNAGLRAIMENSVAWQNASINLLNAHANLSNAKTNQYNAETQHQRMLNDYELGIQSNNIKSADVGSLIQFRKEQAKRYQVQSRNETAMLPFSINLSKSQANQADSTAHYNKVRAALAPVETFIKGADIAPD